MGVKRGEILHEIDTQEEDPGMLGNYVEISCIFWYFLLCFW